jgi:hypothetical protein
MSLIVNIHQLIDTDLSIFLRRREKGMAKQFLDSAQIGAAVKKVGGKRMSQRMRTDIFDQSGFNQTGFEIAL